VLWIGTLTAGLSKLDLESGSIYHYGTVAGDQNSLGDSIVLAIYQDGDGVLWIGTRNGLDRWDRDSSVWHHYRHDPQDPTSLSHNQVWTILEDSSGTLWIGTQAGLDRYDGEKGDGQNAHFSHHPPVSQAFYSDDSSVRSIVEGEGGVLWVASSSVVYQYYPEQDRFRHVWSIEQSLSWERTRRGYSWKPTIIEDRAGALWLGTPEDGLYRLQGEQRTWYQADPQDSDSLSSNSVLYLFEDTSGQLWVGTGAGLDRFDPETETFSHYRVQDGLPNNEVRGIVEDDVPPSLGGPHLWISTVGGLSRFDPQAETFRNYDTADGLQGSEFNSGAVFKSSSGELFFGGMNGFNAFHPEQLTENTYVPPVVVTSLRLFDSVLRRDLASDEQIELSHRENSLSFEFVALDFHAPGKNQYAYRMEGVDEDWVYAGNRRYAEYRDLNPGSYLFRVKGSNSAGVWSDEDTLVHITISPPFWGTWWFRGLVGMVLAVVVVGAFRLRVRGIEARSRGLENLVDERTAELQREIEGRARVEAALRETEREKAIVAERNRLARELHDSVTQSLYAVTLYADAAARRLSAGQMETASEDLGKLGRTAKDALGEMRLLIFELRPPILDEAGLSAALQARLDTVEKRSGLKTEFSVEGTGQLPCEVEDGLYRISLEALNNIVKHAHASRVTLSLYHGSKNASLQVADDGVGFDPLDDSNGGGMGLTGMAERAEQFGGRLTVNSEPGQGTVIRVDWKEEE
jgi:signal transduction histidine kinase